MTNSVSVGELRQNPKPALDAVQDGATVIVTKHGRPIADLGPHRVHRGASSRAVVEGLRGLGDPGWLRDLELMREGLGRDPWASR